MKSYSDKLKDPRWQKTRLKIFERDEFKCKICNRDTETLHAHHTYYEDFKDPWDYPDRAIITLCETCHNLSHNFKQIVDLLLIDAVDKSGNHIFDKIQLIAMFLILKKDLEDNNEIKYDDYAKQLPGIKENRINEFTEIFNDIVNKIQELY